MSVLVVVSVAAAAFAHLFVATGKRVMDVVFGDGDPAEAALGQHRLVVTAVALLAVGVAAGIAALSRRAGSGLTGLAHVKVALDGDPVDAHTARPSLRATLVRALGTFASSVGFVSIGRETAMIETGGALGATLGKRSVSGPAIAAAGVAAAFTAAYTAPAAALAYVDDHLHVRRNARAAAYTVLGAAVAYATTTLLWERHSVLPHLSDEPRRHLAVLGLVVVVPATLGARALFELRRHVERRRPRSAGVAWAAFAVVAALTVGLVRQAAGNGINSLELASVEPVLWSALALALVRFAGMLAALAAGVPGGVILPTMAVTAGWGLLAVHAVEASGGELPGSRWDAMILASTVGVAIGLRSPVMAVLLVPELVGDYTLVPWTAAIVAVALAADRALAAAARRVPGRHTSSRASSPTVTPGSSLIRRHASTTPGMKLERS